MSICTSSVMLEGLLTCCSFMKLTVFCGCCLDIFFSWGRICSGQLWLLILIDLVWLWLMLNTLVILLFHVVVWHSSHFLINLIATCKKDETMTSPSQRVQLLFQESGESGLSIFAQACMTIGHCFL